ncbi:hypothetical protein pXoo2106_22 [Xanthomonas phage pXoo2106]|uniref:Uncharacterized protein n=1 Tax=Xanthomonas phage pXoo2106 TaxID=2970483 RepID=A0AAX3C0T9_9CAUD|nr:hypothetical protein pXoo2106_22 [Xanthomonas phage pXoo2106]
MSTETNQRLDELIALAKEINRTFESIHHMMEQLLMRANQ